MYDFVVFLLEEGVLGLATEISDGIECIYYIDGVEFSDTFESGEFRIVLDI